MISGGLRLIKLYKKWEQFDTFFRHGYFCVDGKDTTESRLVFNRTVPLKDAWNKK